MPQQWLQAGAAFGSQGEFAVPSWVQNVPPGCGHELAGQEALLQLTWQEHELTQSTVPHDDGLPQLTAHSPGPQLIGPHAAMPPLQVISQAVPGLQSMSLHASVPLHRIVQS